LGAHHHRRRGRQSELLRLTPEAQLPACVATGTELMGAIRQHRPDLIILPPELRELAASLKQPPRMMLISPDGHPGDTVPVRRQVRIGTPTLVPA